MSESALAEPVVEVADQRRPAPAPEVFALFLLGAVLIGTAAIGGLFEPTETRYAEIAREMQASGDWLIPRLNGIAHLHKPPLAYWASALGMQVLGPDAPGARIPAAIAALLTLVGVAFAARRRFATLASDSSLTVCLLGTSVLFFALSRSLASDPFLAAGVAMFWGFAPSPLALAGIGIGFLAKGPVVLVHTVLPVLVCALVRRDRRLPGMLGPAWGWLVAAAIALPWYVLVLAKVEGLFSYFLVHQTWERFTTTVHQRGGPPWYFVAVLIAGMLPWTPMLVAGLVRAVRRLRTAAHGAFETRASEDTALALSWLLVPLMFFSFSGSKLPAYLLPSLPPAALLAVSGAESMTARRVVAALLAVLAFGGAVFGPSQLAHALALDPSQPLPLPVAVWMALGSFALAAVWTLRGRVIGAAILVLAAWAASIVGLARYEGPLGSPRPAIRLLASQVRPGEPVVEIEAFTAGVPFYLQHPVQLLNVPREQRLGIASEDLQTMTIPADALPDLVARHGRVWLVGPEPAIRSIARQHFLRFTVLTHWRRRTIGFLAR